VKRTSESPHWRLIDESRFPVQVLRAPALDARSFCTASKQGSCEAENAVIEYSGLAHRRLRCVRVWAGA
jgi:hypothetical protein